uniref:ANK_REP_REGION domain-containing protein n=1 Tax=Heligmosomoides polygyrus TaxID=6339 RepID=A0A8L8KRY0_HELPZ
LKVLLSRESRLFNCRERRRDQLRKCDERERSLPPPRPRRPRLRFSPEVALLEATGRADAVEVERLLREGANPNSHNEDGLTPLHQCAIDDNQQIMLLLLSHGADVNAQDTEQWTPLHAAACCAHINWFLLNMHFSGANLLAVNADGNMPYDICDDETTLDAIESEMAARGITQAYIDDQRGAPEKAMLDDMKSLHQQGLPLDARQPDGSTYLHTAAANGYYDVAAFLLRCGVPATSRDNDLWQPVHAAACWAQPDLVELICEYGGDINAKTSSGEAPLDLCEDETTRAVIATMQQQEARKKRMAFGVRDSRRQSRRRKKFESPQQVATGGDNPFSARGAIRRLSLRDRSGLAPARIEAQKEGADIIRSWSKEDVSSDVNAVPPSQSNKPKPMSPDEWLRKLETGGGDEDEEGTPRRAGSQRRRPKKGAKGKGPSEMQDLRPNGDASRRGKSTCCCVIC